MNRAQKEASVLDIQEKIGKSKGCFLFEYHGLKAEDINGLRRQLKKDKGELKVFKNTLVRLALKGSESEKLLVEEFEGPMACAFSYQDVVATAKTLVEFEKDEKSLNIKTAILDHKKLASNEIKKLLANSLRIIRTSFGLPFENSLSSVFLLIPIT